MRTVDYYPIHGIDACLVTMMDDGEKLTEDQEKVWSSRIKEVLPRAGEYKAMMVHTSKDIFADGIRIGLIAAYGYAIQKHTELTDWWLTEFPNHELVTPEEGSVINTGMAFKLTDTCEVIKFKLMFP